jgi:hypothetical protein
MRSTEAVYLRLGAGLHAHLYLLWNTGIRYRYRHVDLASDIPVVLRIGEAHSWFKGSQVSTCKPQLHHKRFHTQQWYVSFTSIASHNLKIS